MSGSTSPDEIATPTFTSSPDDGHPPSARPLRRRTSLVWPAVLMALLLTACMPAWTVTPRGAPRVAATGDSILRQIQLYSPTHPDSSTALTQSIQDRGWRASVRGENRYIIHWVRGFAKYASDNGAAGVIIVAGVNDVAWIRQQPDPRVALSYVRRQIRDTVRDIGRTQCVVWPTLPLGANFYYGTRTVDRTSVIGINRELRLQSATGSNLTVPEWGAVFNRHPEYALADGLHLSPQGEAALQRILLDAMAACLGPTDPAASPTAPTTVPPATTPPTTTTAAPTTTSPPTIAGPPATTPNVPPTAPITAPITP